MVIFMPAKYQPDYMFLRNVPTGRVHLFTFIQSLCLAGLCVIKEIKSISIIFPIMVINIYDVIISMRYKFQANRSIWLANSYVLQMSK